MESNPVERSNYLPELPARIRAEHDSCTAMPVAPTPSISIERERN
jgi:hypothetical protein